MILKLHSTFFLVLGGPLDSGSSQSVKSTFQFQNVLKIPSTTLPASMYHVKGEDSNFIETDQNKVREAIKKQD